MGMGTPGRRGGPGQQRRGGQVAKGLSEISEECQVAGVEGAFWGAGGEMWKGSSESSPKDPDSMLGASKEMSWLLGGRPCGIRLLWESSVFKKQLWVSSCERVTPGHPRSREHDL